MFDSKERVGAVTGADKSKKADGGNCSSHCSNAVDCASNYRKFRETQRYCKSKKSIKKLQKAVIRHLSMIFGMLMSLSKSVAAIVHAVVSKFQRSMVWKRCCHCVRSIFSVLPRKFKKNVLN